MTYRPSVYRDRGGLNDEQREGLSRLETTKKPTDEDRGRLAALRISAQSDEDRKRVQSLTDRWRSR